MSLSNDLINDIRNSADIVEVLGHYLTIEQKGKAFRAICPFHDDSNPSLSISREKQIYKCFVCGHGGNVFTFVQSFENISFVESVVKVASIIGKTIDESLFKSQKKADSHLTPLYDVLKETIKFTKYNLNSENGKSALTYLEQRGVGYDVAQHFDVGFIGGANGLYKYLKAKSYSEQVMVSTNIVRATSTGMYDVFSNRILFPIHDSYGNPIAFSARTIVDDDSKYINTAETELYTKGNVLYNYHRSLKDTKKMEAVYLLEGVLDVIAMYRANINNTVASLGTALTENQVKLLKRLNVVVIIAYDGDNAGINATYKAGKLLIDAGIKLKIMPNHTGLDLDEVIDKYGVVEVQAMAKKNITWIEFVLQYYKSKFNLDNYSDKKDFARMMEAEINLLEDDFDRQNFSHEVSMLTGFKINGHIVKQFNNTRKSANINMRNINVIDGYLMSEQLILIQMLHFPEAIIKFKEDLGFFMDDVHQKLALIIIDYHRKYGIIDVSNLVDEIDDSRVVEVLTKVSLYDGLDKQFDIALFDGSIRKIKSKMIENKESIVKQKIKTINNVDSKKALIVELQQLQLDRRRLIDDEKE